MSGSPDLQPLLLYSWPEAFELQAWVFKGRPTLHSSMKSMLRDPLSLLLNSGPNLV